MSKGDAKRRGTAATDEDDPNAVKKVMRTVTPPYRGRPDSEMTYFGIIYFLGLVILLIPLLPFLVIVWVVGKILDAVRGRRTIDSPRR